MVMTLLGWGVTNYGDTAEDFPEKLLEVEVGNCLLADLLQLALILSLKKDFIVNMVFSQCTMYQEKDNTNEKGADSLGRDLPRSLAWPCHHSSWNALRRLPSSASS